MISHIVHHGEISPIWETWAFSDDGIWLKTTPNSFRNFQKHNLGYFCPISLPFWFLYKWDVFQGLVALKLFTALSQYFYVPQNTTATIIEFIPGLAFVSWRTWTSSVSFLSPIPVFTTVFFEEHLKLWILVYIVYTFRFIFSWNEVTQRHSLHVLSGLSFFHLLNFKLGFLLKKDHHIFTCKLVTNKKLQIEKSTSFQKMVW